MSAPVETMALTNPRSIRSQTIRPCLATVIAPASVITTKQSLSRAMASSTSTDSPSCRPVKAVSAMPRTSALMVLALERSSGKTGDSLSFTGSCSLRSIPAPSRFLVNASPRQNGEPEKVNGCGRRVKRWALPGLPKSPQLPKIVGTASDFKFQIWNMRFLRGVRNTYEADACALSGKPDTPGAGHRLLGAAALSDWPSAVFARSGRRPRQAVSRVGSRTTVRTLELRGFAPNSSRGIHEPDLPARAHLGNARSKPSPAAKVIGDYGEIPRIFVIANMKTLTATSGSSGRHSDA